jgi:tetrahedral aminopeptidase
MEPASFEFLRELVETGAPSGFEQPIQALYRRQVEGYGARVRVDVMGNTIATINESGSPSVMLAGHMDEIGFLVRYVNDEGFLYATPVGGWDSEIIVAQRVTVYTANGPINGVVGKRAIHLLDPEERNKKSELHALWIDIGVANREEAEKLVRIGDPVTLQARLVPLQGDLVTSKSFDNRMAVWICAETLRLLQGESIRAAVHSAATVQEEIGLRGAKTAAHSIHPQVGVALDVCHAADYPDEDKRKVGDLRIGKGPVITRGANINPHVFDLLVRAAREEEIPHQIEAAGGHTGTDAWVMQTEREGMATGLVSVPVRYMHSPCETLSLSDLENAALLCAAFIRRLTPEQTWTP